MSAAPAEQPGIRHSGPVPDRAGTQRQNQSVHKAAALLRAAAAQSSGATVSALARAAELPRATALRMIESLVTEHFLTRLPDDRIVIGPGLHSIARATNMTELLLDAAQSPMDRLARRVTETLTLTVGLPDGSLAVVRQLDGPHMLGLANWVGRPVPLHASSAGKLALAHASAERVEALLRNGLPRLAAGTVTEPAAFRAELALIRAQGWSQIDDELEDGLAAISAGIWFDGDFVGSLNVSGPGGRFGPADRARVLPPLQRACRQTEVNLGGGDRRG
jgi:DNA-binding IclR family transcriptional regulator